MVVLLVNDYFLPHTSLSCLLQLITLLKCLQLVFPSSSPPLHNPLPPARLTSLFQAVAVVAHAVDQKNTRSHRARDAVRSPHACHMTACAFILTSRLLTRSPPSPSAHLKSLHPTRTPLMISDASLWLKTKALLNLPPPSPSNKQNTSSCWSSLPQTSLLKSLKQFRNPCSRSSTTAR